jgi:hypothetical protein
MYKITLPPSFSNSVQTILGQAALKAQQGQYQEATLECESLISSLSQIKQATQKAVAQLIRAIISLNKPTLTHFLELTYLQSIINEPFLWNFFEPQFQPYHRKTLLQIAISCQNEFAVWKLLEQSADPNASFIPYSTPLGMAMSLPTSTPEEASIMHAIYNLLLSKGADIHAIGSGSKLLWQQALERSDKALYAIMQVYHPQELDSEPGQDFKIGRQCSVLGLKRTNSQFSEFNTALVFNCAIGKSEQSLHLDRKKIKSIFSQLCTIPDFQLILEIVQLALQGASYLKDKFRGFYISNIRQDELYYHWSPDHCYLNLYYENEGFNPAFFIQQCVSFMGHELDFQQVYPPLSENIQTWRRCSGLNFGNIELFLNKETLLFYCRQHIQYLRAKHTLPVEKPDLRAVSELELPQPNLAISASSAISVANQASMPSMSMELEASHTKPYYKRLLESSTQLEGYIRQAQQALFAAKSRRNFLPTARRSSLPEAFSHSLSAPPRRSSLPGELIVQSVLEKPASGLLLTSSHFLSHLILSSTRTSRASSLASVESMALSMQSFPVVSAAASAVSSVSSSAASSKHPTPVRSVVEDLTLKIKLCKSCQKIWISEQLESEKFNYFFDPKLQKCSHHLNS